MKTVQINNPMVLFGLLVCLATASYGASKGAAPATHGFEDCVLQSSVDPNAEMRWHLPLDPGSPIGLWRGVLVQGGQIKAELTASRFQGYGSSIWNHADSSARSEYLLPFIGSQPAYSVASPADVDGFLFTGLGSDFYYGGERSNRTLIRAAEGIWRVQQGCRGFLMFNR